MSNTNVIELLESALINCDNIMKVGPVMIEVVKEQIKAALEELENDRA